MVFEKKTVIDFVKVRPQILKIEGLSEKGVLEHLKLYQGYVNKYNELMEKIEVLSNDDIKVGNITFSQIRVLKVELTFAIGGVKNHEIYFYNLGGDGGRPTGALMKQIEKDFGSYERWEAELRGIAGSARGWAWLAWDHDLKKLINVIGDAQNTFPIWNATPILALDVYEHAYWLDFQTNRTGYIDVFFKNLDWKDVEKRFESARK